MNKPAAIEPEKMDLRSMDIAENKRDELKRCLGEAFPEVFSEGDLNFDQLRRLLGDWVDPAKERFGLTWPGKAECMKIIQQPSIATLKPMRDDSLHFDRSENVFIEGDNLEVLKLLQKAYFGKIKMIYIDPPYNTGGEFIYPDKYAESLDTYLAYTGQVDDEGRKFSTNTDSSGRFHSRWLNMMYPRLYLARNLMREDGIIFISIDDNEITNLRELCNEVFGEENFVATLVWEKGRKNDAKRFSVGHEYLVGYAKNLQLIEEIVAPWREPKEGVAEIVQEYNRLKAVHGADFDAISAGLIEFYQALPKDHLSKKYSRSRFVDSRGIWRDNNISWPGGGGPKYELRHPVTKLPCKIPDDGWRFIESTMKERIREGFVQFREDHTKSPFLKSYLYVEPDTSAGLADDGGEKYQVMGSVFYRHSQPSNDVIKGIFGEKIFENPKDHEILARLIRYCSGKSDIILDFFAGSGTTAHAVFELNQRDGGNRKFILAQLPEPTGRNDFPTIAAIARARIRRVSESISGGKESELKLSANQTLDLGFRSYKLDRSNFKIWNGEAAEFDESGTQLELHVDHLSASSSEEDILYELLLKAGFRLSTKIETVQMKGSKIFSVEDGTFLICLEKEITPGLIDALADANPLQVICLDEGFKGNDQLKTNAAQTFKARAQAGESEIVFKTV
jgi:adenine-specific DNA-methyltransferase